MINEEKKNQNIGQKKMTKRNEELAKDIGKKITLFRKSIKLSQKELAKSSGITPSSLCMIEKGDRIPSLETLRKIAQGLGMTIQSFMASLNVYFRD